MKRDAETEKRKGERKDELTEEEGEAEEKRRRGERERRKKVCVIIYSDIMSTTIVYFHFKLCIMRVLTSFLPYSLYLCRHRQCVKVGKPYSTYSCSP